MSQQLINHNPDLKRLRDEGYHIEVKGGYLVIHQIPYVNSLKKAQYGKLVSKLVLANNTSVAPPDNHVIYFSGEYPHNADGTKIMAIHNEDLTKELHEGITINHTFSNKPKEGFRNYYDKVVSYVRIISHQAYAIDSALTATPFNVVIDEDPETVFQYMDTNSSRANINMLNAKFKNQKIAIIGLGGTGAYILDMIAKTQVKEIHLFDGDVFLLHNAFRSPGAVSNEILETKPRKVSYYKSIYSNMHKHIIGHDYYITEENLHEITEMSYVFICVDRNDARKAIIDYLLSVGVPFIDVGLGVNVVEGENETLIGMIRTTVGTTLKNDHIAKRVPIGTNENNDYRTNIQVADLNNLNAVMAVLKWKKLTGFYQDLENEHHQTYSINVAQLLNEDPAT
ncbi:MAG: ThiF family adenylyltransferase [Bacteroidia bacterium]